MHSSTRPHLGFNDADLQASISDDRCYVGDERWKMSEAHHEWRHRHMIHKPTEMEKWNIHLRSTINLDPVFYTSAQVMIEESQRVVALYFRAHALKEITSKETRYLKRVPKPRTHVSKLRPHIK